MYDNVYVHAVTADETGTSNGLVSKGEVKIHKVVVQHADGTAVLSVAIHDALTITGAVVIGLTTNLADGTTFDRYAEADFNPPLRMEVGVSIDVTGTGTVRIYYSR